MSHNSLSEALVNAVDAGISLRFEKEKALPGLLILKMEKEIEGFGPIGITKCFSRTQIQLAKFDVVAAEVEIAISGFLKEEEKLKVAS